MLRPELQGKRRKTLPTFGNKLSLEEKTQALISSAVCTKQRPTPRLSSIIPLSLCLSVLSVHVCVCVCLYLCISCPLLCWGTSGPHTKHHRFCDLGFDWKVKKPNFPTDALRRSQACLELRTPISQANACVKANTSANNLKNNWGLVLRDASVFHSGKNESNKTGAGFVWPTFPAGRNLMLTDRCLA